MRSRRFVVTTLAALPLALGVTGALADESPAPPAPVEVKQVSFTLSATQCPDLPKGIVVKGTGTSRKYSVSSTDAKGVTSDTEITTMNGTATDNKGHAYSWDYQDAFVASFTAPPFVGLLTDHFDLVKKRVGGGVHTFFVANLAVNGDKPEDVQIQPVTVRGRPLDFTTGAPICDPL